MKKIQGWLQELLNQFKSVIADDDRRRSLVFNCFAAIMGWVSFGMTVVNLWTGKYLLMCVTLIFALLCALNYYLSRKGGVRKKIAYHSFSSRALRCARSSVSPARRKGFPPCGPALSLPLRSRCWVCAKEALMPVSVCSLSFFCFGRPQENLCCSMSIRLRFCCASR